jgi:hypothetical protein
MRIRLLPWLVLILAPLASNAHGATPDVEPAAPTATPPAPAAPTTPTAAAAVPPARVPLPAESQVVPQGAAFQTDVSSGGDFRSWGATISANIPHPVFVELEHRFSPKWSVGLGAGGLSLNNLNINQIPLTLSIAGVDGRVRWHPWGGSFFLGMALGGQKFSGQASDNIPVTIGPQTTNIDTSVTAQITSAYLTPHLGWFKVFNSGFTLGFDFGLQVPVRPQTQIAIATNNNVANIALDLIEQTKQYQDLQTKVQDAGDKIGKIPLPYMTVLRLGWMF